MGAQFIRLNDGLDVCICIFRTEFRDNVPCYYLSGLAECFCELGDLLWAAYADKYFRQIKLPALEALIDLPDGIKQGFLSPFHKVVVNRIF